MVQARPIPGYLPSSGPAEGGSVGQDDLPNGQHLEEINLEARRRHREEKLPPLAKNSSQDLEDRAEADSHPTQNNQEDDAEKILTIEQVEEQENETKENEKNSKKGRLAFWHFLSLFGQFLNYDLVMVSDLSSLSKTAHLALFVT